MDAPCSDVQSCAAITQELVINLDIFKTMFGAVAFVAVQVGAIGLLLWIGWCLVRKLINNGLGR